MQKTDELISQWVSPGLYKEPPQALDLEQSVLGAVILERSAQIIALEVLTPEDFYSDRHQDIFAAILALANKGNPIDMRTVVEQLRRNGKIEAAGGAFYIAELTSKVSSAANVDYHAHVLMDKRILRQLILAAVYIQSKAYQDTTDPHVLLDEIKQIPLRITDSFKKTQDKTIKQEIDTLTQILNKAHDAATDLTGIPSGYPSIDRIIGGWQPTDLIIIAARPSMGKTTFAINCLRNAAVDFKIPSCIFSLEMSSQQLTMKLVSFDTEIELRTIKHKSFGNIEWTQYNAKITSLYSAPIYIDDSANISILDLRIRCRRMVEKYGVRLIVIDYLQLMRGEFSSKNSNREQEISSISRGLKGIAKELNVPVIALSQLSRAVDLRPLPRIPVLGDLRESGAIEQDADIVAFLWRAAYYKVVEDDRGTYVPGLTKFIVAKHRNGELDDAFLAFRGKISKFISIDNAYEETTIAKPEVSPDKFTEANKDDLPF